MARKTKEDAEETRKDILSAALTLFYEQGFTKTKLTDIADSLGLTKGAIYWHFKSKDDLFLTMMRDIDGKMNTRLVPLAESIQTPDELADFIREYVSQIVTEDEFYKYYSVIIFKIEWTADMETATKLLEKQNDEMIQFYESLIKKWLRKKIVKTKIQPKNVAKILSSIVDGVLFDSVQTNQREKAPALIDNGLEIFMKGIGI